MRSAPARAAPTNTAATNSTTRRNELTRRSSGLLVEVELHLWCVLGPGLRREVGLFLEPENSGEEDGGDAFDGGIVVAREVVEAAPLHADAILRALELSLQLLEVGGGPEGGVIFG